MMVDLIKNKNGIIKILIIILTIFGSLLGIRYIYIGSLHFWYSINSRFNDSFDISYNVLLFIEGILLIIYLCVMHNKLHYKILHFIPIVTGIITIIVGSYYVRSGIISNDFKAVVEYSKLIMGGILLIIISCIIIFKMDNKILILIFDIILIINIIINIKYILYNYKYYDRYFYNINSHITAGNTVGYLLLVIISIIRIIKNKDCKYLIFISLLLYGINNIVIGLMRMYIRIKEPFGYYERNDVLRLGVLIFGGILLIIYSLIILNKLRNKIILYIPFIFGMLNIVYGSNILYDSFKYFFIWWKVIDSLLIFIWGLLLIIIIFITIKRYNNKILKQ